MVVIWFHGALPFEAESLVPYSLARNFHAVAVILYRLVFFRVEDDVPSPTDVRKPCSYSALQNCTASRLRLAEFLAPVVF